MSVGAHSIIRIDVSDKEDNNCTTLNLLVD